ncbi:uncharacterized protein [Lolium perenne]|uniref:uncharacterized protein n=1 Tax=Lolium perenne TaxID=4522 RepID=UPI003A9A0126
MPVQHREAYLVEEENGFKSLDKLISRSIRAGDVKKLHAAGIHTCSDLSTCSKKKLAEIKGFSEEKIDIILSASKKLLIDEYDKGSDLLLNGNYVKWIRTANKALEELRCGNLENHPTIHSLDNFRSEKTLLTHSLCVTSQIPVKGDEFTPKVVYIDTLGLFNPDCIVSIAESLGIDGSRVLENVLHIPADSFEKIEKLSSGLAAKISEEPFSLLIVDSVTPLLSTGGKGSMENAVCQSKLKHLLSHLANISKEYNVAVYVTKRDDSEMKLMDFKSTQLSQLEKICDDKEEESTISISVSTLSGFHCLNVNPSDTVSSLIKIVEKRAKLPLGSQYLTYRGKILKPGMRLGDCDMVVNSWFEANSRLLGGAPEINPAQTLSDFVAKDNDVKESMSDGVKVYNNKMAKEIIIPYPRGTKGYRYLVKVAMTPLSNSIFSSMLNKVSKAHAEEKSWGGKINGSTFQVTDGKLEILVQPEYTLDEVNAKEDYKQLSQLFWEYAELNGHHPIYLRSLCSYMDTATKALAQDYKFHLFLRIHPCLLTYSQRSSLFWEIGREFDGFVPSDQADFNSAVDSIIFPTGWRSIAIKEKIFYMTYVRRNYSKYSSDCFRFLRNWLTHGKVNFTKADSRTFNTRSMDYLIEIYFKDFFPDVLWLLTQKNFEGLNEWFCDLTGDDIHA